MTEDRSSLDRENTQTIDSAVRAEIERRLTDLERAEDVRLLFAIESGSRAWGFPSPDSDYDVRFVYAHRRDWYLSLWTGRDVIERPIDGLYDINGWDLRKALTLLVKPNPVLHEWLVSPIRYRTHPASFAALQGLAEQVVNSRPAVHHYLNLGQGQWHRFIEGNDRVNLKKYFYVLRPALALRWLAENDGARVPMALGELRAGTALPPDVEHFLDDLVARKKAAKELGAGPRIPALDCFVQAEFARAAETKGPHRATPDGLHDAADRLFRQIVEDVWRP